jgi:hypothetical protein
MNGYVCFYNGKRTEVMADTSYQALKKAAVELKVPKNKTHMMAVVLAEANDVQVVHPCL